MMTDNINDEFKYMFVEKEYGKCKKIITESIIKCDFEKALSGISIASSLLYFWNQKYTDTFLEESVSLISDSTCTKNIKEMDCDENVIMFYDSFGLDTRGLALIYLKALTKINSKIFYVVPKKAKGNQPELDKAISGSNVEKIYFKARKHYDKLLELQHIVLKIKPSKAFLYTLPNDSAGISLFMQMSKSTRYMVNLTDHAFWLGVHAFDYLLEFRNYGAFISNEERGVEKEKLILIPFYPVIERNTPFQGFPFDSEGKKIIFSGGSLGKSIDKDLTYYKMVERILKNNDCLFVYAGAGDDTYLKDLIKLFPDRVFHIPERGDLFQLMKHVTLYLNTYPLAGGLMTQYAAAAGKIPILLWRGPEHSGILFDQEKRKIEYKTVDELINDVNRLLVDPDYLHSREELLKGSVIEEDEFENELKNLMDNSITKYEIQYFPVDTARFKKDYIERFTKEDYWSYVALRENMCLMSDFTQAYIYRVKRTIKKCLDSI